jgi:hypothetical protein
MVIIQKRERERQAETIKQVHPIPQPSLRLLIVGLISIILFLLTTIVIAYLANA